MVAEGSWGKTSDKYANILALTTQYEGSNNHMLALEGIIKKISNGGNPVSFQDKDKKSKNDCQFTNVGKFTTHTDTGAKHVWCDKNVKGSYMPHNHDHEKWFNKR